MGTAHGGRTCVQRLTSWALWAFFSLTLTSGCDLADKLADKLAGDMDFGAAPEAKQIALVEFEEPVADTVAAGSYAFLLHESSGFTVLELGDVVASDPPRYGPFRTLGRVVAVEYDESSQVAYVVDSSGAVSVVGLGGGAAIRVLAVVQVASLEDASASVKVARSGRRLFVVHGTVVQPIALNISGGIWSLAPEKSSALARPASHIAASSGTLYLGFENDGDAEVESWWVEATGELKKTGSLRVGGALRALVSRGSKLIVLSKTVGLTVLDFYRPAAPRVVYQDASFHDVSGARLFGRTLLVGLEERKFVSTIDVADFAAPRVVTTNKGSLPSWIALVRGNLFMGDAKKGAAYGVNPVLTAVVPKRIQTEFPLQGQIPLTFSKPIDPASLTIQGAVKLTCGDKTIDITPWLSPDGLTVNIRPLVALLAGQNCRVDFSGLAGLNDIPLAGGSSVTSWEFTTTSEPFVPDSPGSAYAHTADGKFTDCEVDEEGGRDGGSTASGAACEWFDVQPAQGRFTYFYADYDGANLWLLNDWFYNGENIDPDCYNEFQVWTGGGAERWEIRAYGDQHVEVLRNGEKLDATALGLEGGAYYGPSPNVAEPHTIYELKIPAQSGSWGVQLHDPGPTFVCQRLEADTTSLTGTVVAGQAGGTVDTTVEIKAPARPKLAAPENGAVDQPISPELSWSDDNGIEAYAYYRVEVARDAAFANKVLNTVTWSKRYVIARGLLAADTTYYWRVIAQNQAGSSGSAVRSFTTSATPEYLLSVGVSGQGLIMSNAGDLSCSSSGGVCQASLVIGTQVSLSAMPAEGWDFAGWYGSCAGTSSTANLTVQSDSYCVARFTTTRGTGNVWVSRQGSGQGSVASIPAGVSCGSDCSEAYALGTLVTLVASPSEGSVFAGWYGDCSGSSPNVSLTLESDVYCTAVFNVPPSGKYTLSTWANGGGSITSDVGGIDCPGVSCQQSYEPNSVVTLTATAQDGFTFEGWTGDCQTEGREPTTTVTLSRHMSCGATFVSNTPSLYVYVSGPGAVSSSPAGIACASNSACTANFARDSQVTLTAQPTGEGAVFAGWNGDCSGTSSSVVVTMDTQKSCTALFTQTGLSVYVQGSGTVTSSPGQIVCTDNGGSGCSQNFASGSQVTLTATPGQNYSFAGWGGDCSGQDSTASVTVVGSMSCTATFTTNSLHVYVSGVGSVASTPQGIACSSNGGTGCSTNYANGTTVQLTATPGNDYVFVGWSGCSSSSSASIEIDVSGSQYCYANFASNSNTLSIYGSGNGSGTVSSSPTGLSCTLSAGQSSGACSPVFAYDQQVTLTATPTSSSDYFTGWSGHCSGTATTASVTMAGGRYCYATFERNRLSVSSWGQGSITSSPGTIACSNGSGTCSSDYAVGSEVQLTAAPADNYVFAGWSGCSQSTEPTITLSLSRAASCHATFTTNTLTTYVNGGSGVIASADGHIECSSYGQTGCTRDYATYGQQVELTATPDENHVFVGWSGCSSSGSATITVSMTGAKYCYATFEQTTLWVYVGGTGSVTSEPSGIACSSAWGEGCSATFAPNTVVQLTASAGENQVFAGWTGDCTGVDTTTSVTLGRARSCTANFRTNQLSVSYYYSSGSGTVTSSVGAIECSNGGGTCSAHYALNQEVTLTATASTGSAFSQWYGDCSGQGATATVNMTQSRTCYPVFTLQSYSASLTVTGRGVVTSSPIGIACGSDCSESYAYGTSITLTAVPYYGETFEGWAGDCADSGSEPTIVFAMPDSGVSCTATFSSNNESSAAYSGTFTSTYDQTQCTNWNAFRTGLSASVTYDGISIRGSLDPEGVSCSGASANTLCQALRTGTTVTGVSCGGKTWDVGTCGGSVELHAANSSGVCSCNDGYTLRPCLEQNGGYSGIGTTCQAAAQTLEVDCSQSNVQVSVTGRGTVTGASDDIQCPGDCSADVANGESVTLTATPADGETFLGWSGDCDHGGTEPTVTFEASSTPTNCAAQFSSIAVTGRVLIAAADEESILAAIRDGLLATGAFEVVDTLANPTGPTPPSVATMQQYDVVLVWTRYAFTDATALGNNLADYYDAGGNVVVTVFATGGFQFAGRFADVANGYMLLGGGGYTQCGGSTLGVVEADSELLAGVSSINHQNAYCSVNGAVNGGTVVATWGGASPMVVRGVVQGRKRVDLNLWLYPSSLSGDYITLVKNALLYR